MMRQSQHVDRGKLCVESSALVAATAVYHQDFETLTVFRCLQRLDGAAESRGLIEGDDDRRDSRSLRFFLDSLGLPRGLNHLARRICAWVGWAGNRHGNDYSTPATM